MIQTIAVFAHSGSAIAFLMVGLLVAVSAWKRAGRRIELLLLGACVLSAATAAALAGGRQFAWPWLPSAMLGTLASAAWIALIALTLAQVDRAAFLTPIRRAALALTLLALALQAGLIPDLAPWLGAGTLLGVVQAGLSIVMLLLLENLVRNTEPDQLWSIRFLATGLGALAVLDLLIHATAILEHQPDPELVTARSLLSVIAASLVAITVLRNPHLALRSRSRRKLRFHTATLTGAGLMLQAAAIAGIWVGARGGGPAAITGVTIGASALMVGVVALSSGRLRAALGRAATRALHGQRYDYRREWLRFIEAMGAADEGPLGWRVVRAVGELVDSPGGALWMLDADGVYQGVAQRGMRREPQPVAGDDALLATLAQTGLPLARDPGAVPGTAWLPGLGPIWLLVPLMGKGRMAGFLALRPPRISRAEGFALSREETLLLQSVALQSAQHLLQEQTARALADAEALQDFTTRTAFLMHDFKGLVGQLSLTAENAARFAHDPAFHADMAETVRLAAGKMRAMLERLAAANRDAAALPGPAEPPADTLAALLARFQLAEARLGRPLLLEGTVPPLPLSDPDALGWVLDHVVQNARDAMGGRGSPTLRVLWSPGRTVLEVQDRGPGMSSHFVATELFRPLRSTKRAGFGIGAFQARETMRRLGGSLRVASEPGRGTVVTLTLPDPASAIFPAPEPGLELALS